MQSKTERLKEYGMYIKRTSEGTYNLGWTQSQRRGGIANYPTYNDAYNAFEDIVSTYWEYHGEDFMHYVESALYQQGRQ